MSNFLTDARTALLDELKGDARIAARVKTWFEFGPGTRRRYNIEPSACPLLALAPSEGRDLRNTNALREFWQHLAVEITTDGQDAAPCEELVALVTNCIVGCDETCLGLADSGLLGLRAGSVTWTRVPQPDGPRAAWTARVEVVLRWVRSAT